MSRMTALQAQLEKATGKPAPNVPSLDTKPDANTSPQKAPSREGKVHIGAYLSPDFKRSLRLVQAQTGEDTQTIIARALNELFRGHNVPVIEDR